ncbi:ferritin-3, chloroplastic [Bombus pyrosoma]|uniref:ferritin-3, chloroplastic n=1 Tax=Bombus pyrosoma TaxID=396416 RepID=UPI001CB8EF2A|nr:ferritin-3, chloroplastic [Bombus pyrosoma]XP_043598244.1 ferritin-3, chloroplastic [Bombus pyrosoma]
MLFFGILSILLAVAAAEDTCYDDSLAVCDPIPKDGKSMLNCNAKYGHIERHPLIDLQSYANANIRVSFEFLLMSSYFGNYEDQRHGFKKLYRKFSDELWEDAINIIKYVTKRGDTMDFNQPPHLTEPTYERKVTYELNELHSLAKALDRQKELANKALNIHHDITKNDKINDAGVAHYVEERFIEPQADRVRDLAGYINDLKNLLTGNDHSVALFLFDEYLKNSL